MNDSVGRTKRYQIPLSHLNARYIEQCTDGNELENIYKELINGPENSHHILERVAHDRLVQIHPQSQLIRNNNSTSVIDKAATELKTSEEWRQFEDDISSEFDSDTDVNKRAELAQQAMAARNYQQAIDLYSKNLRVANDALAYLNRAIAYYELNNFDAAIADCTAVLAADANNVDALLHRARCYLAKQVYVPAREDADRLLSIDPENSEAQDLMNTLISVQKSADNQGETEVQPPLMMEIYFKDDPTDATTNETPLESPPPYDDHNINQFQISSNDDDDGMQFGDEASGAVGENEPLSRSINVSPTNEEGIDMRKSTDQSIAFNFNSTIHPTPLATISDDENELYDHPTHRSRLSSRQNDHESSIFDQIANSSFGLLIQSWLKDLVASQTHRSYYDRPWSKSPRPYSLDRIHRDIERFARFNDYPNAIDVSKKLLHNNLLDYHSHAECIVETLNLCAACYLRCRDSVHAIQYASEALEYYRKDGNALLIRGQAFEMEKLLLFSYSDFSRVPSHNFDYPTAKYACERLATELNPLEGENWREKLSYSDEQFLTYFKLKMAFSEEDPGQWFQTHAEQFLLDACFILAIQFFSYSLEFQPERTEIYLKRAACYLKVHEPQKVIQDCDRVLRTDPAHSLALYYKASAYRMSHEYRSYENTLREYLKYQPNNQIVLSEYHSHRHEQIPRRKRRLRTRSVDELVITYEELEDIRLDRDFQSNEIKEQCSFILHLQSLENITTKFIADFIYITRVMIQAEEAYQREHPSQELPFSYIQYCFNIWLELNTHAQIDYMLPMIDDTSRNLLDELIAYYRTKSDGTDPFSRLKQL